ncbi:basic proline-rich protein-like [Melospiza georgiana]|uniref:basic proline-rich protein-like n=1 Tax=Melospiza georgiana TaxID=44398 RepID=UPI0025AD95B6|nr:basic proline-rich protein-like [Melospiza georgiana]XP_057874680.1 basic proline-rich protein-like [Melospiza georgiana]XP_057874688.1 basic proline-rich protein-like [Melospiza georgiana]
MTAQTERAIHRGPSADKAEAAQKPTRLPGSEAVHSSRPLPPGAPRRAPLPGAPVPPRARYLGLRSVPGELPAAAGDGGGERLRAASSPPAQLLPGMSRPGSVGAVGCLGYHGVRPARCPAPRCQQHKAPEPCGEEEDAELLQDAAEPPRPWQMLIPGSVSGSRQSPRPRRPPLPGDPREPHPSAWPTCLQRPPGSRGPARGTRAALGGSIQSWGALRDREAGLGPGGDGAHARGRSSLGWAPPAAPCSLQLPGWQRGVLETQARSTLALRVRFSLAS